MMPTRGPRKPDERSVPAFLAPLFPLLYILGFTRSLPIEGSEENQEPDSETAVPLNLATIPAPRAEVRGALLSGPTAEESCVPEAGPQGELRVSEVGGAPLAFGPLADLTGPIGSKLPEVAAALNPVRAVVEMGTK